MRSIYPQISIASSIGYLERSREAVLASELFTRTQALGFLDFSEKSGAGQNVLSSLTHYGLLEKIGPDYRFTSLCHDILKTSDKALLHQLIKQAALYPPIFKDIDLHYRLGMTHRMNDIMSRYGVQPAKRELVVKKYLTNRDYLARLEQIVVQVRHRQKKPIQREIKVLDDQPHNKDTVTIDFGKGMVIAVPKKIILKAYLEELQKLL